MANHILSLEIDQTLNQNILKVLDTSTYMEDIAPQCPTLQITLPNYDYPIVFEEPNIEVGFHRFFTACDLKVQLKDCGTKQYALPDGIYIVRWSVSPNKVVYAEYNHLRITKALNKYNELLCEFSSNLCAADCDKVKNFNKINEIKMYLDAAVNAVEVCHDVDKGLELYQYALELLNKTCCN